MNAGLEVAVVQHDIVWEDRSANLAHLSPVIAVAAEQGARLVVLTEMFSAGFSTRTDLIQEPPDGPSTSFLVEQAGRHDIWVLGSVCVQTFAFRPACQRCRSGVAGWKHLPLSQAPPVLVCR